MSHIFSVLTRPFIDLWQGKQPLGRAFWLFFVLGFVASPIAVLILGGSLLLIGQREVAYAIKFVIALGYPVFAGIGVWRSANARPFDRWPIAAAFAKIGVCFFLIAFAMRVAGYGAQVHRPY